MFLIKYQEIPGKPVKFRREFFGNAIDAYADIFNRFFSFYDLKELICCDEFHIRKPKPRKLRVCRFCGTTYNKDEKFRSDAHLIPGLLGNKFLYSDFECDKCNFLFGKYESNLADFLGAIRAMNVSNARTGTVKFKSPDKSFIVMKDKEAPLDQPKLRIESHELQNDHFTLDAKKNKVTFHTKRASYIPHQVFKSLLKIGLSVLPEEDIADYEIALAMLRSQKKNEETDNPLYKLNMYQHKGPPFPIPMALVFEKKDKQALVPMHIVAIMFYNYTYQLILPFNKQDSWMYNGKTITVPNMPPFIDKHFEKKFGPIKENHMNFNLDELKKGEKHDITYSFDSYTDTRFPDIEDK